MEGILTNGFSQLGAVGLLLASFIIGIRYVAQMFKEQQIKSEKIEFEFRGHLITTQKDLMSVIDNNTDSFKQMTQTYDRLINIIKNHNCKTDSK